MVTTPSPCHYANVKIAPFLNEPAHALAAPKQSPTRRRWNSVAWFGVLSCMAGLQARAGGLAPADWPREVDLRPAFVDKGLSMRAQGHRGTCSVFAVTGAIEYALACERPLRPVLSVEFLNWASNQVLHENQDGGFFSDLWTGFLQYGLCAEAEFPYAPQYDMQRTPSPSAMEQARALVGQGWQMHWIKRWNVQTGLTDDQFLEIKQTLARQRPVCAGMRWPKAARWERGVLQMAPAAEVFDGHSVLLVGYRDDDQLAGGGVFLTRDSGRGDQEGALLYAYARAYFNDAVWIEHGAAAGGEHQSVKLGSHVARYDRLGRLLPWTSWEDALGREMKWYQKCPSVHGYPAFVTLTFMDGSYKAVEHRADTIPAMQNGMGILSYLKYYAYQGRTNAELLGTACSMADYLIREAVTPDQGRYPRFVRSTGVRGAFPQPPDAGRQEDRPFEIEPDKGGIAGYAFTQLFVETKDARYLEAALQQARALVANAVVGTSTNSPWPFRADFRTGEGRGSVSANMSYILRLFEALVDLGHAEFQKPRDDLWRWIKTCQIPDTAKDALLWAQFHEDYNMETNRNAWSALNLTRYLVEKREKVDPDWQADAQALLQFVLGRFVTVRWGIVVCGEQDDDKDPWGGALTNFGGTLALYAAATGSDEYKGLAHAALTLALYAIDEDGCPRDSLLKSHRGGWQEDAHTDVIHNYMDALRAFPDWAR